MSPYGDRKNLVAEYRAFSGAISTPGSNYLVAALPLTSVAICNCTGSRRPKILPPWIGARRAFTATDRNTTVVPSQT